MSLHADLASPLHCVQHEEVELGSPKLFEPTRQGGQASEAARLAIQDGVVILPIRFGTDISLSSD